MGKKVLPDTSMMAGRIYKVFYDDVEECYVGQTRMIPVQRLVHHINAYHANKQDRQCAINALFIEHGVHTAQIKVLETLETCTDQELDDRERYWIENTSGAINRQKPQPMETNQRTSEGKKAYMVAYRAANEDEIKAKEAEYKARPDVKARAKEQQREWRKKNADHVNEQKAERVTCEKCGFEMSKGHAWEHTERICNNKKLVKEDTAKALELKASGMSQRAIASDPYFAARGYKPTNHDAIGRLLRNAMR